MLCSLSPRSPSLRLKRAAMPKLHFTKLEQQRLREAMASERVLRIFRAGLPKSAKDRVTTNGYVDGTFVRVSEYLITLIVPTVKGDTETPAEFLARQGRYEHGERSAMCPPGTSAEEVNRLALLYDFHWEVSFPLDVPVCSMG